MQTHMCRIYDPLIHLELQHVTAFAEHSELYIQCGVSVGPLASSSRHAGNSKEPLHVVEARRRGEQRCAGLL